MAEGIAFQPIPVEVLGGLHGASVTTIKKLAVSLARATGQLESDVVRHVFGRLSILLQRGNSALILSRVPTHPQPQIDGNH